MGQQLGSGRADRVLGSNDQKRRRYRSGHTVYGYAALLHYLQKRRLGLGGGTVDLIRQKNIAHGCAGTVKEAILFPVIYGKACNIGR